MDIQHKVTLTDTEIVSLVNFIEYWNDVQQADQDLLDNIAKKLDNTIIKHSPINGYTGAISSSESISHTKAVSKFP